MLEIERESAMRGDLIDLERGIVRRVLDVKYTGSPFRFVCATVSQQLQAE